MDPTAVEGRPVHDPPEHDQFLQKAKAIAREFHVTAEGGGSPEVELALLPNPLHVYEDPDRHIEKGVLLAWCHRGNPEALICVEFYPDRVSVELTKLANARVVAEAQALGQTWDAPEGKGGEKEAYRSFPLPRD